MKEITLRYKSGLNQVQLVHELSLLNKNFSLKAAKNSVDKLLKDKEVLVLVNEKSDLSKLKRLVDIEPAREMFI